eukprot:gene15657-4710_t
MLAEWIVERVSEYRNRTIVIGDFNVSNVPTVESYLRNTQLVEMVRGRTTFRRKGISTSLDRTFISHDLKATLELHHNSIGSDHSQMIVNIPIERTTWMPIMLHPVPSWKPSATTYEELWTQVKSNGKEKPRKLIPTKIKRLRKAEANLIRARARAKEMNDLTTKDKLNRDLRQLRQKITHLNLGYEAERHVKTTRQAFAPPLGNREEWRKYFSKKFKEDEKPQEEDYLHEPTTDTQTIPVEDLKTAIGSLKKRARTADFSVRFVENLGSKEKCLIAEKYSEWLSTGIPEEKVICLLFPVRKPGKRGQGPQLYRPICIMGLEIKLLHHTVYTMLRDTIRQKLKESGFQLAGGWCMVLLLLLLWAGCMV